MRDNPDDLNRQGAKSAKPETLINPFWAWRARALAANFLQQESGYSG
jgi:hypothetical protein